MFFSKPSNHLVFPRIAIACDREGGMHGLGQSPAMAVAHLLDSGASRRPSQAPFFVGIERGAHVLFL